jgi:hypothetical protein
MSNRDQVKLVGLNRRQRAFAEVIWHLGSRAQVEAFRTSLPQEQQRDLDLVVELMVLSFHDEIDDVEQAATLLDRYRLR